MLEQIVFWNSDISYYSNLSRWVGWLCQYMSPKFTITVWVKYLTLISLQNFWLRSSRELYMGTTCNTRILFTNRLYLCFSLICVILFIKYTVNLEKFYTVVYQQIKIFFYVCAVVYLTYMFNTFLGVVMYVFVFIYILYIFTFIFLLSKSFYYELNSLNLKWNHRDACFLTS